MTVSIASLAFCLARLREGLELKEVADLVKQKFEGTEQEIAVEWLRDQHRLANRK